MTIAEIVEKLTAHRTIGQAPREELEWIATHGHLWRVAEGEVVSRSTEPVEGLYIVLTGRLAIYVQRGSVSRRMMEWQGGEVTGTLPYSRMTNPPGDTVAEEPSEAITVPQHLFPELIRNCPAVTGMLVHVMTDRARRFTSAELRDEMMISLGKVAAGLAHEVNNPASASLRDAQALTSMLEESERAVHTLLAAGLTAPQREAIDRFCGACVTQLAAAPGTGLALADREDALASWLQRQGMGDELAGDLARAAATVDDLERLSSALDGNAFEAALRWIAYACSARALAKDIVRASQRINELVSAVKGFTHMDRDLDVGAVDIRKGLMDTVAMLRGKARQRSLHVSVDAPEDLPSVRGFTAEINQIWMNLIDNAMDAAPPDGTIAVTAVREGSDVVVTVSDDGPGIPEEIQERVFEPFFTTKPVGKGTGLGLDIVRRVVDVCKGDVRVESAPGRTSFIITLPAAGGG